MSNSKSSFLAVVTLCYQHGGLSILQTGQGNLTPGFYPKDISGLGHHVSFLLERSYRILLSNLSLSDAIDSHAYNS